MKIKNITISNFGNIKNQTINTDQNIILLESKDELLTILKWFMSIETIDSFKEMYNLLNERSTINVDFVDTKNNLIRYSEYKGDKMFKSDFSIGNFTTSHVLTGSFSEHFFPQEYANYSFLELERGYKNDYIAQYINRLKKWVRESFSNRPPHDRSSEEVINFTKKYVETFKKVEIGKGLYFLINKNNNFVLQDSNDKTVRLNKTNRALFTILCFIYTNHFFSLLKEYDEEMESAYTPLLIKGNIFEKEKDIILNLLKEQKRQVFILS